jgi:hypothetical protein
MEMMKKDDLRLKIKRLTNPNKQQGEKKGHCRVCFMKLIKIKLIFCFYSFHINFFLF